MVSSMNSTTKVNSTKSVSLNAEEEEKDNDNGYEGDKIIYQVQKLPVLKDIFRIHAKIGEGTFSSVFLATLKYSEESRKFAIKYLVPTCHPGRIERELQCLRDIGGTDNVVGVELCLRNAESIVFVMPYMKHDKFSDYVHSMGVDETRNYMKALLTALRRVHKFNIIHRDVKPSNFLYDRRNGRYLLVDFGLAQQYTKAAKPSKESKDMTTARSVKRRRSEENGADKTADTATKHAEVKCTCFGKPAVCFPCFTKPQQTAPRAGTPGFRAPEVLLKYQFQTPAIDIWASGVMMLCILSGTQPFFRSPDDCTALAEITSIFGSAKMQYCARKLGKRITFSENVPGIDIVTLCQKLQMRNRGQPSQSALDRTEEETVDKKYPASAYDLLSKLLDPDHKTRITAEEALNHPFLAS